MYVYRSHVLKKVVSVFLIFAEAEVQKVQRVHVTKRGVGRHTDTYVHSSSITPLGEAVKKSDSFNLCFEDEPCLVLLG
jgi:hypothetical protein